MFIENLRSLFNQKTYIRTSNKLFTKFFVAYGIITVLVILFGILYTIPYIIPCLLMFGACLFVIAAFAFAAAYNKVKEDVVLTITNEFHRVISDLLGENTDANPYYCISCQNYNDNIFTINIHIFPGGLAKDGVEKVINPILTDINYISDVKLKVYYCDWPTY